MKDDKDLFDGFKRIEYWLKDDEKLGVHEGTEWAEDVVTWIVILWVVWVVAMLVNKYVF